MTEYLDNTVIDDKLVINDGWRVALDAYCNELDVRSEETRKAYRKWLKRFFSWMVSSGRSLDRMKSVDIVAYRNSLQEDIVMGVCTVRSANSYLSAIRSFYKWAECKGFYENIAASVNSLKKNKEFIKMHLTDEQGKALLRASRERSMRDFAMENMMLRLGLRTVEVSRLNINSIRERKGKRVVYVHGKGHSEADSYVVMTDSVYGPIREYLESRDGALESDPLFVSESDRSKGRRLTTRGIQDIIKKDLRSIGLDSREYSPHSLRHTTGVMIIENGGSLVDVQRVLRHTSPKTSEIYLLSIEDDQHIKNAPERLLDNSFNI